MGLAAKDVKVRHSNLYLHDVIFVNSKKRWQVMDELSGSVVNDHWLHLIHVWELQTIHICEFILDVAPEHKSLLELINGVCWQRCEKTVMFRYELLKDDRFFGTIGRDHGSCRRLFELSPRRMV